MAETQIGEVISCGNDVKGGYKKGDVVMISRFGGTTEVEVVDGEIVFVAETSVLCKLD